jgi:LPS-assembly lipoprotein
MGMTMPRTTLPRRLMLAALAGSLLLSAAGCGFKLRGQHDMAFKTVQLTGFASTSPFAIELARALEASGVDVVDSSLQAAQAASSATVPITHVIIESLVDSRGMVVATTTAYGQVRDMTVRNMLRFKVLRGDGTELLPPSDVSLAREMTYNERDALAKQDETEALHRAMQTDIVGQVLRRLAAIRPDQLATPSDAVVPAPQPISALDTAPQPATPAATASSAPSATGGATAPAKR